MSEKTPKCLWCKDPVALAGQTCDPICARLHRVRKVRHAEPVALVTPDWGTPAHNSDKQYHGDRAPE